MHRSVFRLAAILGVSAPLLSAGSAFAQTPQASGRHEAHQPAHPPQATLEIPAAREGSGTSWLPDFTPIHGVHLAVGSWQAMIHGSLFVQYISEDGARGDDQTGSVNWIMAMASRPAAGGKLSLRGMLSFEPWTVGRCGYPNLLATGELCNGEPLHDRQHPHDLLMETAAAYERPIGSSMGVQAYAALAGEPALGPVAFPHRMSAYPNVLAPIAHHWLDSTHVSFGVLTGGVHGRRWKAEASAFNGREPDEERFNVDLAALDSYAGRFWFLPGERLSFQVSAGLLREAEAGHDEEPRRDVTRTTASATYHRPIRTNGFWATTAAWGRNREEDETTMALLIESAAWLDERQAVFGRAEWAGKSAHDLGVPDESGGPFTVAKLVLGYAREWRARASLVPGLGGQIALSFTPDAVRSTYEKQPAVGFAVFLSLRPARVQAGHVH
jgi:hypothetical protein